MGSGGATLGDMGTCRRCAGFAWVCEHHPDMPFQHGRVSHGDACRGDGMPCNCAAGRFLVSVLDARCQGAELNPARDECVLWRLVSAAGEPFVCHAVAASTGELALTVERGHEVIVAEIKANLDAAIVRADELRASLVAQGLREPA